jgi:hypothetical protein
MVDIKLAGVQNVEVLSVKSLRFVSVRDLI